MPNYVLVSNSLNKVSLHKGQRISTWLIDTGASISVVKYDSLKCLHLPIHKERIVINGIGGKVFSEGFVYLKLNYGKNIFEHKFYVFETLPCKTDGILGQDFLIKFRAKLDFELSSLHLFSRRNDEVALKVDYFEDKTNIYLTAPARSETIHYIDSTLTDDSVVSTQELCEGVYIASMVVKPKNGKIPIKIHWVTDVNLKYFNIHTSKFDEYDVCNFDRPVINADRVKKLLSSLKLDEMDDIERKSIQDICSKFPDIFFIEGDKLGTTSLYEQTIELKPHSTPVYVKPYRLPHAQKEEIDRQIQGMLKEGIIEEARSAWSSPLLLVPKKLDNTGVKKWRVVIDYRKLNEQVQDDKFPLPNITDILDSLSGSMYFSHLDLYQGFYQCNLHKQSRPYTAFTTSKNQYQMTRLPMGLKTSPNAFSRMITVAMSGLNYEKCLTYQDDLAVFGRSLEIHNQNLLSVFLRNCEK